MQRQIFGFTLPSKCSLRPWLHLFGLEPHIHFSVPNSCLSSKTKIHFQNAKTITLQRSGPELGWSILRLTLWVCQVYRKDPNARNSFKTLAGFRPTVVWLTVYQRSQLDLRLHSLPQWVTDPAPYGPAKPRSTLYWNLTLLNLLTFTTSPNRAGYSKWTLVVNSDSIF